VSRRSDVHESLTLIAIALIFPTSQALSAGAAISGRIHDAGGQPLKDVTITAAESNLKTFSGGQGDFAIQSAASTGTIRLLFELPGYYPETVLYEMKEPAAPVDVVLTPRQIVKEKVKVVASRLDISLAANPAATTVVGPDVLDTMSRSVAIDEPLQGVPGVKVDKRPTASACIFPFAGRGF
jgi:outer membrane receptor protein involved in Fe transport